MDKIRQDAMRLLQSDSEFRKEALNVHISNSSSNELIEFIRIAETQLSKITFELLEARKISNG